MPHRFALNVSPAVQSPESADLPCPPANRTAGLSCVRWPPDVPCRLLEPVIPRNEVPANRMPLGARP